MIREPVPATQAGDTTPWQPASELDPTLPPETSVEAERGGPDSEWVFWHKQIAAGLLAERRFRQEALEAEQIVFGPDDDPGTATPDKDRPANEITDRTALIHSNIEVLKPLVYSETPTPIVRRRFRGDTKLDETALMAAEAGQRLAAWIVDTEDFDEAMKAARDDWLIAGRGAARAVYSAEMASVMIQNPLTGMPEAVEVKAKESVAARPCEWRRLLLAPGHAWKQLPWLAIEVPMTRARIEARFGAEVASRINYRDKGIVDAARAPGDEDEFRGDRLTTNDDTGAPNTNPFDVAMVWEIHDKESRRVIWWSNAYRDGVLDKEDDPLGLEGFFPMPKPLLASVKGQSLNPRPDVRYYEERAREIDIASQKLADLLEVISVSALVPGKMSDEWKKLLSGRNQIIAIQDWIGLMEKGGLNNLVQWLPLQAIVAAMQALVALREQAKQAMYEASGISDIMRAQGDPTETATAQQLKGRYAGLRLKEKQTTMAFFARDMLRILLELALEHFDTRRIAAICDLDLPLTEAERQQALMAQEQARMQFAAAMQAYQALAADLQEAGVDPVQELGPPPVEPQFERIPETSWELIHARLRDDFGRNITVQIETSSTVIADEQEDKEARVEFLAAMATFVQQLMPLVQTGQFDFKTVKELLMFGIRGFPKSRTLEAMIAALPDEPQVTGDGPDPSVQVAEIKAKVDLAIEEMRMADKAMDREHETKLKGIDLVAKEADLAERRESRPAPKPEGAPAWGSA